MSDQQETAVTVDRIKAMLDQEGRFYTLPDYMSPGYLLQPSNKHIDFVEECARLASDKGVQESTPPLSARKLPPRTTSFARYSPNSVATNDFVSSACPNSVTPDMDHSHLCPWRRQMCDWAYTAMDIFELDREMVAVAFDLLDRYLANEINSEVNFTREDFQLYCMVCLYIAVKILEPSRKLSVEALTDMSRGYYSAEDVEATELEILQSLQWRLNGPTTIAFVRSFLELVPNSDGLLVSCQEFAELAVADSFFVPFKSSSIAAAAITLAAQQKESNTKALQHVQELVNLHSEEVRAIHMHIANLE